VDEQREHGPATEGPASESGTGPEAGAEEPGGTDGAGADDGAEGRRGRSPWSEAFQDMQQVVEDVIEGVRQFPPAVGRGPRLDFVRLPEHGYRVYVDLAGVRREDVDVTTLGDELVIQGERARPELPEGAEVLRTERAHGRFRRSLRLPAEVDPDAIRARLVEGVLEIALPLRGSVESRSVEIE